MVRSDMPKYRDTSANDINPDTPALPPLSPTITPANTRFPAAHVTPQPTMTPYNNQYHTSQPHVKLCQEIANPQNLHPPRNPRTIPPPAQPLSTSFPHPPTSFPRRRESPTPAHLPPPLSHIIPAPRLRHSRTCPRHSRTPSTSFPRRRESPTPTRLPPPQQVDTRRNIPPMKRHPQRNLRRTSPQPLMPRKRRLEQPPSRCVRRKSSPRTHQPPSLPQHSVIQLVQPISPVPRHPKRKIRRRCVERPIPQRSPPHIPAQKLHLSQHARSRSILPRARQRPCIRIHPNDPPRPANRRPLDRQRPRSAPQVHEPLPHTIPGQHHHRVRNRSIHRIRPIAHPPSPRRQRHRRQPNQRLPSNSAPRPANRHIQVTRILSILQPKDRRNLAPQPTQHTRVRTRRPNAERPKRPSRMHPHHPLDRRRQPREALMPQQSPRPRRVEPLHRMNRRRAPQTQQRTRRPPVPDRQTPLTMDPQRAVPPPAQLPRQLVVDEPLQPANELDLIPIEDVGRSAVDSAARHDPYYPTLPTPHALDRSKRYNTDPASAVAAESPALGA